MIHSMKFDTFEKNDQDKKMNPSRKKINILNRFFDMLSGQRE